MAKIAVDADGVLADFTKAFQQMANTIWPGRMKADGIQSGWDDWQGLTKAQQDQVWAKIKATTNFWTTLDAYPENVGALAKFLLTSKHHDVHIVTSRMQLDGGMTTARQTKTWLFMCGLNANVNYLGIIPVDDSNRKQDIYDAAGIQWSVDDKAETVIQCDKLSSHRAYLLDRPWNQHVTPKRRIKTLSEYFADIAASQGDPK